MSENKKEQVCDKRFEENIYQCWLAVKEKFHTIEAANAKDMCRLQLDLQQCLVEREARCKVMYKLQLQHEKLDSVYQNVHSKRSSVAARYSHITKVKSAIDSNFLQIEEQRTKNKRLCAELGVASKTELDTAKSLLEKAGRIRLESSCKIEQLCKSIRDERQKLELTTQMLSSAEDNNKLSKSIMNAKLHTVLEQCETERQAVVAGRIQQEEKRAAIEQFHLNIKQTENDQKQLEEEYKKVKAEFSATSDKFTKCASDDKAENDSVRAAVCSQRDFKKAKLEEQDKVQTKIAELQEKKEEISENRERFKREIFELKLKYDEACTERGSIATELDNYRKIADKVEADECRLEDEARCIEKNIEDEELQSAQCKKELNEETEALKKQIEIVRLEKEKKLRELKLGLDEEKKLFKAKQIESRGEKKYSRMEITKLTKTLERAKRQLVNATNAVLKCETDHNAQVPIEKEANTEANKLCADLEVQREQLVALLERLQTQKELEESKIKESEDKGKLLEESKEVKHNVEKELADHEKNVKSADCEWVRSTAVLLENIKQMELDMAPHDVITLNYKLKHECQQLRKKLNRSSDEELATMEKRLAADERTLADLSLQLNNIADALKTSEQQATSLRLRAEALDIALISHPAKEIHAKKNREDAEKQPNVIPNIELLTEGASPKEPKPVVEKPMQSLLPARNLTTQDAHSSRTLANNPYEYLSDSDGGVGVNQHKPPMRRVRDRSLLGKRKARMASSVACYQPAKCRPFKSKPSILLSPSIKRIEPKDEIPRTA